MNVYLRSAKARSIKYIVVTANGRMSSDKTRKNKETMRFELTTSVNTLEFTGIQ